MPDPSRTEEVTQILAEFGAGDASAAARLMDVVYAELRALAGSYFRKQSPGHTLQPTALVHEAFVRLADRTDLASGFCFKDREHFFAVSALVMRGILADHARRRRASKRGGDRQRLDLTAGTPIEAIGTADAIDILALDEALDALAALSPRQARIVAFRFFSGMTVDQIASVLRVSRSTVEAEWRLARAWLRVELGDGGQ